MFGLLSLMLLALPSAPAQAGGILWCKSDPVVSLNGRLVDITAALPLEYVLFVTGPTQIEIQTPPGVERFVVISDLGFNGHGTEVTFVDGGGVVEDGEIPTRIRVTVPIHLDRDEQVPMEVTVWADDEFPLTVSGTHRRTVMQLSITSR